MEKLNDKWIRIGGVSLLLVNLFVVDYSGNPRRPKDEITYIFLYLFFVTLVLEADRFIIVSMHRRYPAFAQSKKRF